MLHVTTIAVAPFEAGGMSLGRHAVLAVCVTPPACKLHVTACPAISRLSLQGMLQRWLHAGHVDCDAAVTPLQGLLEAAGTNRPRGHACQLVAQLMCHFARPLLQGLLVAARVSNQMCTWTPSFESRPLQGLLEAAKTAHKEAKAAQSMILKDELKARRRVLRRLG